MQRVKITGPKAGGGKGESESEGNRDLIIFALGWGADEAVVSHIRPRGYDVWAVYDYRTIEPLPAEELARYDKIYLFAWSFGVWASEVVMGGVEPYRAVAFGGTPYPVDDRYGIPAKIFALTLRSIGQRGPEEFNRRTYGELYDKFVSSLGNRTWEERLEELHALHRMAEGAGATKVAEVESEMIAAGAVRQAGAVRPQIKGIKWEAGVIGERDAIFPPANMEAWWGGKGVKADLPHYPFGDATTVEQFLDGTEQDRT